MYKVRLHSNLGVTYWPLLCGGNHSPTCLQIYQTVGNTFLFQQDNASIPAVWQGTVCELVMSYPLTCVPGPESSLIGHHWDILGQRVHDHIPFQLQHFPNLNTSWLNNGNVFHKGMGLQPHASFKHAQKVHRKHSFRWR